LSKNFKESSLIHYASLSEILEKKRKKKREKKKEKKKKKKGKKREGKRKNL